MKRHKNNASFTLIELLIVIAIIGILAALIIVSVTKAAARARDARRLADMNEIHKALDAYYLDNGNWPSCGVDGVQCNGAGGWDTTIAAGTNWISFLVPKYLPQAPVDPINSGSYYYAYYVYPAGNSGCNASLGDYYVVCANADETGMLAAQHQDFTCPQRDWNVSGVSGPSVYCFGEFQH
ncbi:prepilin-type N-terminal cleavage/methylation domain-containing protein [Patescibacteria group bacterium]|nr:prepilin-type N-terminal cleavage/methylation domain-containing protein [Patescibacteria group bacterium]